jgi:hypothetical protein
VGRGVGPGFCVFAGVFEGGFGKSSVKRVVFVVKNVVECVVNVGNFPVVFRG